MLITSSQNMNLFIINTKTVYFGGLFSNFGGYIQFFLNGIPRFGGKGFLVMYIC